MSNNYRPSGMQWKTFGQCDICLKRFICRKPCIAKIRQDELKNLRREGDINNDKNKSIWKEDTK